MNPAALKTNIMDLPRGRCPDRQQRRLHDRQPDQGRLHQRPADRWLAQGLHALRDPHLDAQRPRPREPRDDLQAGRPDQELLRPGRHVLALRALHGSDLALDRGQVREAPGRRGGQSASAQGRLRLRRNDRDLPHALPRRAGPPEARPVSQHHRQRGDRARFRGRLPPGRSAALLRLVSDHARQRHPAPALGLQALRRQDLPGRGRDRGHRGGHRGQLWRGDGHDRHLRPGHLPQVRGHGPGGDGRAAARRRRHPARRTEHGHAHQDRAGRPAAGHVRAQRRISDAGRRAGHARPTASTWPSRPGASP